MLATGESADFSFRMNGPNQATEIYTQSNDYSFDTSKTALSTWEHVVLVQNGTVIWGAPAVATALRETARRTVIASS